MNTGKDKISHILLRTHSAMLWREREGGSKNKRYKKSKTPFINGNLTLL